MVAAISKRLGLDQPLWKQYVDFVWNALHGNLGYDYYYQLSVTHIIIRPCRSRCRSPSGRP